MRASGEALLPRVTVNCILRDTPVTATEEVDAGVFSVEGTVCAGGTGAAWVGNISRLRVPTGEVEAARGEPGGWDRLCAESSEDTRGLCK